MTDYSAKLRAYYANVIMFRASTADARLHAAFAAVPREHFVGPGPWRVFAGHYIDTPSDDLAFLYQDVLVALADERGINNGLPSLHVACLAALQPQQGERVLHVGAGAGYYSAILAELVGAAGKVVAYEIEPDLARLASGKLAAWQNVELQAKSATLSGPAGVLGSYDAIYVNAGATHPPAAWLDAVKPGGRLLFPLTPDQGLGGMLLLTGRADGNFAARFVCLAAFIPCIGARTAEMERRLAAALRHGTMWNVRSLRRDSAPDTSCWLKGEGWWLSTAALD